MHGGVGSVFRHDSGEAVENALGSSRSCGHRDVGRWKRLPCEAGFTSAVLLRTCVN
jgi:hypothetical protein